MKKKFFSMFLSLSVLAFSACGSTNLVKTGNSPIENAVYSNDFISLAPYTGLKAEKAVYSVSEENIQNSIHEQLSDYADYKSVSRASKTKDWVYFDYTAKIDGEVVSESSDGEYYIVLGDEEFGDEFDDKMTGVKKGAAQEFDISYPDNYENDSDWAGHTVHFSITVTDVQKEILPEATDSFLKENLGFDSYDEFIEDTKESLADSYEEESMDNLKDELLLQVVDSSSILAYEKQKYEDAYALAVSEYEEYAEMFGMELEDIYDFMGVTDDELEETATQILYRGIVQDAIVENENITLNEAEYQDGLEYYAELNDYESTDALLEDFSEDELRKQITQDKVLDFLVAHAQITEVPTEYIDE